MITFPGKFRFIGYAALLLSSSYTPSFALAEEVLLPAIVMSEPCLLLIKSTKYLDGRHETSLCCELSRIDGGSIVTLTKESMPAFLAEKYNNNEINSARDYLHAKGALVSQHAMIFPSITTKSGDVFDEQNVFVEHNAYDHENRRHLRRLGITGERSTLVIPATFSDSSTTATDAVLRNKVFGANGDSLNLRSQMDACSFGKLDMKPVTSSSSGVSINGGVYRLNLSSTTISGKDSGTVEDILKSKANDVLGDLADQYDHVMFCMPPKHSDEDDWIGYAYFDYYRSVFNNEWCNYPSIQMHEIGHNFELMHSGELDCGDDDCIYEDQTGLMGFSYSDDEWPFMCYNAPKNVQLGWYDDRIVNLSASNYDWVGSIYGITNYGTTSSANKMILYITNGATWGDITVSFNRQTGINKDTVEYGDKVLVHVKEGGGKTSVEYSYLAAHLSVGQTYTVPGTKIPIKFESMSDSNPKYASVRVGDGSSYVQCDGSCCDPAVRLKIVKNDGDKITRNCSWVANNTSRCNLNGVATACPVSCGTCSTCQDSELRFKLTKTNGEKITRNCGWVARKQTSSRCALDGAEDACRLTCGKC